VHHHKDAYTKGEENAERLTAGFGSRLSWRSVHIRLSRDIIVSTSAPTTAVVVNQSARKMFLFQRSERTNLLTVPFKKSICDFCLTAHTSCFRYKPCQLPTRAHLKALALVCVLACSPLLATRGTLALRCCSEALPCAVGRDGGGVCRKLLLDLWGKPALSAELPPRPLSPPAFR